MVSEDFNALAGLRLARDELLSEVIRLYNENVKLIAENREHTKRIQELEMEVWNL